MKTRRFLKLTGIFVLILGMALFSANTVLSEDSVLFGVFGPMTGPAAETGKQIKSGAIMAVEEINAKGGILGKKIELVFGDSESKPSSAVGMMERLITHDKVQLVTGGLHSDIALATMDVTAKYRVPQILNTQVSGEITKKIGNDLEKFKYVFKNGPSPMVYKSGVPGVLDMLDKGGEIKFKKKTVAFFRERSSWGRSLEQAITKGFSDIGWKVVAVETVEHAQSDYLSLLSKVKSIAPDVIVCLQTSTAAASSLAKQFVEKRIPSLLVPIFIPSDPHYIELAGDAANGVLWLVNIATLPNAKGKAFTAAFEKRWGMGPAMTAALQHDLMYMIKAAYEKAGSFDKDKFAEAYLSTNYAGNTGIYTYDPANHQVRAGAEFIPTLAYQIQNKQNIVLWPERYAVGSFITPPWF